ncbi:MAG: cytidine deaminase [Bacilli bacterium]|nr:cytidine deaminase [Bacilli bacterium]MDD3895574.1 cytidine deaminase [Bacilli bacterium]MDD4407776.1 cytidine deaminase [Bacilli bacterium]
MKENLERIINNSYSPYSKFKTACIVKMNNGQEFIGVNVENASFKNGLCAEQVAIAAAIAEGYSKEDFDEIHIYGDTNSFTYPCFLCRQLLLEFFDLNKQVYIYKKTDDTKVLTVNELCPYSFQLEEVKNG